MTPTQRAAALRLAKTFDDRTELSHDIIDAAALLRELASEPPNCGDFDKLIAELEADPAFKPHLSAGREWVKTLAKPQGEPVAWVPRARRALPNYHRLAAGEYVWEDASTDGACPVHEPDFEVVQLYAHPPQRKPLTSHEIAQIADGEPFVSWNRERVELFVREVERKLGIGEAP